MKLTLNTEEKYSVYRSVLDLLESGEDNKEIAQNVLQFIEDTLVEKEKQLSGEEGPKGPVFRRVED